MRSFVYRITAENDENVYRDILVQEDKSLEDFHYAILDSFDLASGEMASFYTSDESWTKGVEFTLMDMGTMEHEAVNMLMQELTIGKAVDQEFNRFIFAYDFLFPKNFFVEFLEENTEIKEEVPVLLKLEGEYKPENGTLADVGEIDFGEEETTKKASSSDLGFDDLDDDDEPQFENIDDLDL